MNKTHSVMEQARGASAFVRGRWSALRWFALALLLAISALSPAFAVAAEPQLWFHYPSTPERDYAAPGEVHILLGATGGCGPISIYVSGPIDVGSVNNGDTLRNLPPGRYFIDASFEMCDRRWLESPVGAGRAFNVLGGSITASPGTCTIPWGGSSCGTTINWSSNAPNAQVWYSLPDGSSMTLLAQGQNGAAMAGIDLAARRFYLKSGTLTLATVDVNAVPTHNSAPSATLTAPGQNQIYQVGSVVAFAANASDPDDGVQRVEFLVDGVEVGEDASAPYELHWTGTEGGHTLAARAVDTRGAQTTSPGVWIVVNGRPSITLTSPANGAHATLPASFLLKADASDFDGVNRVEFYADNVLVNTDSVAPYEFPWSGVGVGTHTVHAIVHDNLGGSVRSATSTVTVAQPPSGPTGVARRYVYDQHQQLCKVIEPETGSTVMGYDAAGNLNWSASGLSLPDTTNCNHNEAYGSGRRVQRYHNNRNRLTTLNFPDGNGDQNWTYTPDGLPSQIVTFNDSGASSVINTYAYNKRRLLTNESVQQPNWYVWGIVYGYNAHGSLATQTYPTGLSIDYAPNALGQATKAGTYATGVSYYPNGGIAQFTYGNGIVHTMTQNARQLPARSTDSGGALDHEYGYDGTGNVTHIFDHVPGNSGRWMAYDGLGRLTLAGSAAFGGDHWHRYTYDALDNMKSWKLAGVKDYATYYYDPSNRLTNIQNSAGASIIGLGYDVQGNLQNKNGQNYSFDYGNRLREVTGKDTYRYDGYGRRVRSWNASGGYNILTQYSQAGQVLYRANGRINTNSEHIYLAGSLVATRESGPAGLATRYQHTDALGSPVAVTNEAGQVVERTNYEPYGAAINRAVDGVGYTGHVMDAATGLTYMQQRYYDPTLGRFLSVDPVTADGNTGANFNRYKYASNNPYRFTDPDGRVDWDMLGDSFKLEVSGGLGLQAKVKMGPVKASLGLGDASFGGGATLSDVYGFQEVAGPSMAIEGGRFALGYKGSMDRSEQGRNGSIYSEKSSKGGWVAGFKKANMEADEDGSNGEISATFSAVVVRVKGSIDFGKVVDALKGDGFQGTFRVEGRIDSQRLDKELSKK